MEEFRIGARDMEAIGQFDGAEWYVEKLDGSTYKEVFSAPSFYDSGIVPLILYRHKESNRLVIQVHDRHRAPELYESLDGGDTWLSTKEGFVGEDFEEIAK